MVKRGSDIVGRRKELRAQMLNVIEKQLGSGPADKTAKETEGDPRL